MTAHTFHTGSQLCLPVTWNRTIRRAKASQNLPAMAIQVPPTRSGRRRRRACAEKRSVPSVRARTHATGSASPPLHSPAATATRPRAFSRPADAATGRPSGAVARRSIVAGRHVACAPGRRNALRRSHSEKPSNFRFFQVFGAFADTFNQLAKCRHFLQIDPHNRRHGVCGKPPADRKKRKLPLPALRGDPRQDAHCAPRSAPSSAASPLLQLSTSSRKNSTWIEHRR